MNERAVLTGCDAFWQDNYVNVMVEGSSRAMVSYAKFIIDSEDAANPVTLKKVQVPSPTA